jgi:hypothetical protein
MTEIANAKINTLVIIRSMVNIFEIISRGCTSIKPTVVTVMMVIYNASIHENPDM